MKRNTSTSCFVMATYFMVSPVLANDVQVIDAEPYRIIHGISASVGKTSIDSSTAAQQGVEDSATSLRLSWEGQKESWLFGTGMNVVFYSDRAGFSNVVEDAFGNISSESSDASAFNVYGETGYSYSLTPNASVDLLSGIELSLESSRSIPNCRNCDEQDIDIDPGFYVKPRVRLFTGERFYIALDYQQYLSGDFESNIAFSLGLRR